jgi:hypothetical protein
VVTPVSIYTTQDLIQILQRERTACMQGDRLTLAATGTDPVLGRLVGTEGLQRFTAYSDFRGTIHKYQVQQEVSGLVWQQLTLPSACDPDRVADPDFLEIASLEITLHYPQIHDQLIALPSDLAVLRQALGEMLAFWQQGTQGMDLFLGLNGGKRHQPITRPELAPMLERAEWASLYKQGRSDHLEVILQLGWGQPGMAQGRRGWPHSGSDWIYAVQPGRQPLR